MHNQRRRKLCRNSHRSCSHTWGRSVSSCFLFPSSIVSPFWIEQRERLKDFSHSPMTVTWTSLVLGPSNSMRRIDCHCLSFIFPFMIGMETSGLVMFPECEHKCSAYGDTLPPLAHLSFDSWGGLPRSLRHAHLGIGEVVEWTVQRFTGPLVTSSFLEKSSTLAVMSTTSSFLLVSISRDYSWSFISTREKRQEIFGFKGIPQ